MSANAGPRSCEGSNPPPSPTLFALPNELLINIMESLPDMATLATVCRTHPRFQSLFKANQGTIPTGILRTQLGPQMFSHALTAHRADELACSTGLHDLDADEIRDRCDAFRQLRDDALARNPSAGDAAAISRNHVKVLELTGALVDKCPHWPQYEQTFAPLAQSLQARPPSADELTRIGQAIYLHMMLRAAFVGSQVPPRSIIHDDDDEDDSRAWTRFRSNMTLLQKTLVERTLAPWELAHAMAATSFFRREMGRVQDFDFAYFDLSQLHRVICRGGAYSGPVTESRFMVGVLLTHGPALPLRPSPEPAAYRPFFAGPGSAEELRVWREMVLRAPPRRPSHLSHHEGGMYWDFSGEIHGRLALWCAPLWDYARWAEVESTLEGRGGVWKDIARPHYRLRHMEALQYPFPPGYEDARG